MSKSNGERAERLREIQEEILDLLEEAAEEVRGTSEQQSARAYWYAHIKTALLNEHEYLGGSMHTLEDSIKALDEDECESCGDELLIDGTCRSCVARGEAGRS